MHRISADILFHNILASINLIYVLSLRLARKDSSSPLVASAAVRSLAEVMLLLPPLLLCLLLMLLVVVVAVIRCYCSFHCGGGVSVKSFFCYALLCILSSFTFISLKTREFFAVFQVSSS